MPAITKNSQFRYYMHEGPDAFSFELAGALSEDAGRELEQARRSASRVIAGRSLIVDMSYVTGIDSSARAMLRRWHGDGAQLVAGSQEARSIVKSITGQGSSFIASAASHNTWRPFYAAFGTLMLAIFSAGIPARAADLKPETAQAWDEYVKSASARHRQHIVPGNAFLSIDEVPGQAARIRAGEILISPASPHVPVKVPSGLIHDWVGAAFIPGATIPDVMRVIRDYECYKDVYHPNVVDSRPLATNPVDDRFSLLLMNKAVVAKVALNIDYQTTYTRLDDHRWSSVTEATRVQEIAGYGTPSEHALPEDRGTGLIWRMVSFARFEERDGGVAVELEALALSRDIPAALRWMVDPIVRRISRSSMATSLKQTQDAVTGPLSASRASDRAAGSLARSFR